MKLWSGVLSPFSTKVRIALAEKGLEYEMLQIPWTRQTLWGPKPPEFLAVSPHGKVPVLIDGEATVYDATVIAEYLEDRYPDPSLFPADAVARATLPPTGGRGRYRYGGRGDAARAGAVHPARRRGTRPGPRQCGDRGAATSIRDVGARAGGSRVSVRGLQRGRHRHLHGGGIRLEPGCCTGRVTGRLTQWFQRMLMRPCVAREFEAVTRAAAAV